MAYTPGQKTLQRTIATGIALFATLFITLIGTGLLLGKIDNPLHLFATISLFSIILFSLIFVFLTRKLRRRKKLGKEPFPEQWAHILDKRVAFYHALSFQERDRFNKEIQFFLNEKTITGIKTEIDDETRLLVAASAIIPIFSYPGWEYDTLGEILIYPSNFDDTNFDFSKKTANTMGLVTGRGGTLVLSKPALYRGFENSIDRTNVGIHEFVHKIDGEDGSIDGVPALMMDKHTSQEWLTVMKHEMELMRNDKSDINPYGLTNEAEFFAVVSEYFFENPARMEKGHSGLYRLLKKIYRQDTKARLKSALTAMVYPRGKKMGRNTPCPCGSGLKYKKCCLGKTAT